MLAATATPPAGSVQADAANYLLHVDAVAVVHPRGYEVSARPGVAGVIAHPVVAASADVWVGESRRQLRVGEVCPPSVEIAAKAW
jgi:hypothetical protein